MGRALPLLLGSLVGGVGLWSQRGAKALLGLLGLAFLAMRHVC